MTDIIACERQARKEGLAAGLAAALEGMVAATAPGPVAAVPSSWVTPDDALVEHRIAALERIAFVRCDQASPAPAEALARLGVRLAAMRLGITGRLTEHAVTHLSGRVSGGEPTVRKQLVQGTIADLLTGMDAVRAQLEAVPGTLATVADIHEQISALDWEAVKLLGASGFLADSPGRAAHVSELTANCWVLTEAAQ